MLYHNILHNDRIALRALEPDDTNILYKWENNTDIWMVSNTQKPFSKDVLLRYIENSVYDIYTTKQLRLMIDSKQQKISVGAIDLFDFDPNNLRAGIGIVISEEYRSQNYAFDAIEIIKKYASQVLNLHQLYANITIDNTTSLALFRKCGFDICGIKKDWTRTPNSWIDEYTLQIIL